MSIPIKNPLDEALVSEHDIEWKSWYYITENAQSIVNEITEFSGGLTKRILPQKILQYGHWIAAVLTGKKREVAEPIESSSENIELLKNLSNKFIYNSGLNLIVVNSEISEREQQQYLKKSDDSEYKVIIQNLFKKSKYIKPGKVEYSQLRRFVDAIKEIDEIENWEQKKTKLKLFQLQLVHGYSRQENLEPFYTVIKGIIASDGLIRQDDPDHFNEDFERFLALIDSITAYFEIMDEKNK